MEDPIRLELDSKEALWPRMDFDRALVFAARAHQNQQVPGTEFPYLVHCARVATEVMLAANTRLGVDLQLALSSALLHDVLEDTPVTPTELEAEFGPAITAGVKALSKDKALAAESAMADSLARIRQQPGEIWMVKLADRVCNLAPPMPPHWDHARITRYRDESLLIYDALAAACAYLGVRLQCRIERLTTELRRPGAFAHGSGSGQSG